YGDGLEIALAKEKELAPGASLRRELAVWLNWRLRDRARKRRRDGHAEPVGASEDVAELADDRVMDDVAGLVESRMALDVFRGEFDLGDSRMVGKLLGVPSCRPVPTGQRGDVW